jgi:hypothetical protein
MTSMGHARFSVKSLEVPENTGVSCVKGLPIWPAEKILQNSDFL